MTNQTTRSPDPPDDEELVVPEPHGVPDHLDLPIEVPEADAIEQELEVPIDDDEH